MALYLVQLVGRLMKMFIHHPALIQASKRYSKKKKMKTVNIVETHTYTLYEMIYLKTSFQDKSQFLHINEEKLILREVK